MALALRLRRALAAASLLRPAAAAASTSRSLPLAPIAPPPHPRPALLPGAAAGFRSTAAAAAARGRDYGGAADDNKISPDEILFEGCDYNHWLITMEFPDPQPSREEMIETYLQTLAKVVGSYEEAKKRMYAFSTTTYIGFQAEMTEEMSEKFRGLPGVVFILPDSYLYPETKEYGGDKYENGVITPRPPPVHYNKPSRNRGSYLGGNNQGGPRNYQDGPRNYQDSPPSRTSYQNSSPSQGRYQNSPPSQGSYQGSPPRSYQNNPPSQGSYQGSPPGSYQSNPAAGYENRPPQQGNFQPYRSQQDGTSYAPASGGYRGHVNPAGQGHGYDNPQENRNFSQGQGGDFIPGGPSARETYGQSSTAGNYGQLPPSMHHDDRQVAPGIRGYGGGNRQGPGPAYGGDNWQGESVQYPGPGEGHGNWQGRQ